jgi:hypothetical protein
VALPRPKLTQAQKDAAQEELESIDEARTSFGFIVPLGEPLVIAADGLVGAGGWAVVAAVMWVLLGRKRTRTRRAIEDPPRRDYETTTIAMRPLVDVESALRGLDVPESAVPASLDLSSEVGLLSALTRSSEHRVRQLSRIGRRMR